MEPQESMSSSPIKEELALILLENELPGDAFLNFGSLSDDSKKESLAIVGYPSNDYSKEVHLSKVKPDRKIIKGNLHSINDFVINHTMVSTEVGHSGSPILALNKDGYEVVGIHTHKGLSKEYKSGIYFNDEMRNFLREYVLDFMDEHNLQKEPKVKSDEEIFGQETDDIQTIELDSLPEELDDLIFEQTSIIERYEQKILFFEDTEREEDFINTSLIQDMEQTFETSSEADSEQSILFEDE